MATCRGWRVPGIFQIPTPRPLAPINMTGRAGTRTQDPRIKSAWQATGPNHTTFTYDYLTLPFIGILRLHWGYGFATMTA